MARDPLASYKVEVSMELSACEWRVNGARVARSDGAIFSYIAVHLVEILLFQAAEDAAKEKGESKYDNG